MYYALPEHFGKVPEFYASITNALAIYARIYTSGNPALVKRRGNTFQLLI
jgi:hypothetical protein